MQLIRFSARLAILLIVTVLVAPPLFSQFRQPAQQTKPQPQIEQIAAAINDLLKQHPLNPKSKDDDAPENDATKEQEKPPADDAPISELIAYWRNHSYLPTADDKSKPSAKVRERILEACENRPWLLARLTHALPETADTYDRLYKLLSEDGKEPAGEVSWQPQLRRWLKSNSPYFREELVEEVRQLSQNNVMDLSPVNALVRLDWDAAKPLVEAMAGNSDPYRAAQALGITYAQANRGGDSAQADGLRAQLKAMVINRQSPATVRQTAFQSLMATEWSGRDDWYLSLFADSLLSGVSFLEKKEEAKDNVEVKSVRARTDEGPRLFEGEGGFNILGLPIQENPAKWLPAVIQLVGNNDRTVHLASVSCLAEFLAVDTGGKEQTLQAARALLPWLTDPKWGGGLERWSYLGSLSKLDLPESVPGLIWVLDNDEDPAGRAVAAEALMRYRSPQAIAALRRALDREKDDQFRESIIVALVQSGGFSDEEAAAAIEAYARRVVTDEGEKEMAKIADGAAEKSLPLPVSIGRVYDMREEVEITEGLAAKLFARAKAMRPTEPAAARRMISIAERADLMVTDLNLIDRIGEGVVDLDAVKLALESRERMRKRASDELFALFKQGGYAGGLTAVLLGDDSNWSIVLKGNDAKAQTALLAAARYTRDKLPVEAVGKLLNGTNQPLAAAAESYLEIEDSAEARKLVWAKHPGEARILGERVGSESALGSAPISKWEEKMRKEVLGADGPDEVYAVVPNYNPEVYGSLIIRVRKGQAEISLHNSEGRRRTRLLTANELQELKEFTSREEVENLGPQSRRTYGELEEDRMRFQYLRLSKEGGRRIMLSAGLRPAPKKGATPYEQLSGLFYQLSHSGEFKLRYAMEDKIPGLEVLLADDKRRVFTACQENGALRVLVEPEREDSPRIAASAAEWRSFASGQLGAATEEPISCRFQNVLLNTPDWLKELRNRSGVMLDWRSKVGDVWFGPAMIEGEPGIWKLEETKDPVKVTGGTYLNSIVTPDGKWLVAKKTVQTADRFEMQVTRINLQTGREFIINAPQLSAHYPIAFVPAHNKVLLGQGHYQYGRDFNGGTNYLLDPETGATQQVKGEFRPLQDQFTRPLQSAEKPSEFWAAIYDQQKKATVIGRYDARAFTFAPVIELPEIRAGSPDVWVDAAAGKVYVTYSGHLLRIPLPPSVK